MYEEEINDYPEKNDYPALCDAVNESNNEFNNLDLKKYFVEIAGKLLNAMVIKTRLAEKPLSSVMINILK